MLVTMLRPCGTTLAPVLVSPVIFVHCSSACQKISFITCSPFLCRTQDRGSVTQYRGSVRKQPSGPPMQFLSLWGSAPCSPAALGTSARGSQGADAVPVFCIVYVVQVTKGSQRDIYAAKHIYTEYGKFSELSVVDV